MINLSILFFFTHISFIIALFLLLNNRNNVLVMFITTELLNLTGIFNYIFYFYFFQNYSIESLALIFFALIASEAAIGLILILNYVKLQNTLSILN